MKKIIVALTVLGLALCLSAPLMAQPQPGQNQNGSPTGGNPSGGAPIGAPIGGGAGIMIALSLAYAISRNSLPK